MATANDIVLPGSSRSSYALRCCDKCAEDKRPEGGMQMRPGRWLCAVCWRLFNAKKKH